uniref:progranulin-like n=1 Tax=Scatophagus argus TaxID=75038 RepID=UPI001ED7D665|nr:progranulin-like [Scatophagus argus]
MLRVTLCLFVGAFVWPFASCSITCPDGNVCSETSTCCLTRDGYSCCPYPKAVCCSDLAHCCPSGFSCNLLTQHCEKKDQPWMNIPMVKKEAAEEPNPPAPSVSPLEELKNNQKSSVVHCDNYYVCPDGTTCCRHPKGGFFCCLYSPGRCCLDGFHCCPYGYDCDHTYTHCIRQGLRYPFIPKETPSSVPAALISTSKDRSSLQERTPMTALTAASSSNLEAGVIRCDYKFYCPAGSTCCKGSKGQWNCCPYPLGQCCSDGQHCCEYGYNCDATSKSCKRGYIQFPSRTQERAKTD